MEISIQPATREHAPLIAKAILMAIGEDLTASLAGDNHVPAEVEALFAALAARTDTQYSYLNTLAAIDENGIVAGLLISYDGAELQRLRIPFFKEAAKRIGLIIDGEPVDETGPEEIYLDTVAVFPEYRGRGIAGSLIASAADRARRAGKPLGLLVSKQNPEARKLYEKIGFRPSGERPFAGEMMSHMQLT